MADCLHGAVPPADLPGGKHSNAAAVKAWQAERSALDVCNADKKALRVWADSTASAVKPK